MSPVAAVLLLMSEGSFPAGLTIAWLATCCSPGLSAWDLACLESLSAAARSVLIGVAQMHGIMSPAEALRLARLEEDFQSEEWGLVEGGHDIDGADFDVRVTAPLVMQMLLKP